MKTKTLALNEYAKVIGNQLQSRFDLMDTLFGTFSEGRLDSECGYPLDIPPQLYKAFYLREGIAARVVDMFPDECWRKQPEVYDTEENDESSPFEQSIKALEKDHNIWSYLHRLDCLAGIGRFGILLLGVDDGLPLDAPLEGIDDYGKGEGSDVPNQKLLYLRPFDESLVLINQFEVNPNSPRYGKPLYYSVNFIDSTQWGTVSPIGAETLTMRRIHWTRVIHVAEKTSSSEIFGLPRMQNVFNRLYDLKKICGGSAEMFWKGGFPGLSLEINPDLQDVELDKAGVDREMRAYQSGLKRYLAMTGVSAKTLAPNIADPTPHLNLQCQAIALSKGIPLRVFMGTEQGVLAGSQDAAAWAGRVEARRDDFVNPNIVREFVDRLIAAEIIALPEDPEEGYQIYWKELTSPDETSQAQIILQKTQALQAYVAGQCDNLIPPVDYFVHVFGLTADEAQEIVDSAGKFLGVSLDDVAAQKMDLTLNPPTPVIAAPGGAAGAAGKAAKPAQAGKPTQNKAKMLTNGEKPTVKQLSRANIIQEKALVEGACVLIENLARLDAGEDWKPEMMTANAAKMSRNAITLNVQTVEHNDITPKSVRRVEIMHNEAAVALSDLGFKTAAKWHLSRGLEIAKRYSKSVENYSPAEERDKYGKWTASGGGTAAKEGMIPVALKDPKAKPADRQWINANTGKPAPDHVNKMAIPPGWSGVWAQPDKNKAATGYHAIGMADNGKKQYLQSPAMAAASDAEKYQRIDKMVKNQKAIAAEVNADIASDDPRTQQSAQATKVMMATGIRPGGVDTGAKFSSQGVLDLEGRNVKVASDGSVSLSYIPGKKGGQTVTVPVNDPETAAMLIDLKNNSGPRSSLFPDITDNNLYRYTKSLGDGSWSSKDFRTFRGTSVAAQYIKDNPPGEFKSMDEYQQWLAKSLAPAVAKDLNNTPSVALTDYINPSVYEKYKPKK